MVFGGTKPRARMGKRIRDSFEIREQQLYSLTRRLRTPNSVSVAASAGAPAAPNVGQSGSYLPTSGGTMVGAIAFFPQLITLTASKAIDIAPATGQYTSRVILSNSGGNQLETISNARHSGQILFIQGVQTESIVVTNAGNIETIDGNDTI